MTSVSEVTSAWGQETWPDTHAAWLVWILWRLQRHHTTSKHHTVAGAQSAGLL